MALTLHRDGHNGAALAWWCASMLVQFDIRCDDEGWTVYDRLTDEPAVIDGYASTKLSRADAEEIADLLNTLALIRPEPSRIRH
ncbi:MAG TPA: hypothetical protein VEA41_19315 [Salinarimonas sp.]|nr:hypothetical protein [Salinarimonas sp.]